MCRKRVCVNKALSSKWCPWKNAELAVYVRRDKQSCCCQAVWPDWAIYSTLGIFLKPLATINLPKSLTFLDNFYKGVKIFIFLVKSFLGNFYWHLAIFFWSHCCQAKYLCEIEALLTTIDAKNKSLGYLLPQRSLLKASKALEMIQ